MLWSMSSTDLNPVSYVVLGLIARDGPSTAYELKTKVGRGIAHFWPFPHSQIYSETERLAHLGLLAEEREGAGRRRRIYRITRPGQNALRAWLANPAGDEPQYRSLGLLKLFFGQFAAPEDIAGLAEAQVEMHRQMFETYELLLERLKTRGDRPWQLAVGELLVDAYRAMAQHWKRIARQAGQEGGNPRPAARTPRQRGAQR